ncbi:MAG: hypothetical protein Q9164_006407, partial [Protoblastenia rupestris]
QGSDVIRSQRRDLKNFLLDYDVTVDLLACTPEGEGKLVYQLTDPDAIRISGEDADYSKRQLWDAIEEGQEIVWKANVQIIQAEDADPDKLGFDPFDVTKVWPRGQFPMHEFGRLVLNKNPENYHRDVEQAASSPGSMVPGIEDSPDPLLQFCIFFYRDAQYHRIGVNLHQIPVNCPSMAGHYSSLNSDGPMRVDANLAGIKQCVPNSFKMAFRPDTAEAPYAHVMDETARDHTHRNTAKMMARVPYPIIQKKYLARIYNIAPEYPKAIYDLLPKRQFEFSEVEELSKSAETFSKEPKFWPGEGDRLV